MKASSGHQLIGSDSNFLEKLRHPDRAGPERGCSAGERMSTPGHAATLHFYTALNDFPPPAHREGSFARTFHGNPAAKDLVEALAAPHTESI